MTKQSEYEAAMAVIAKNDGEALIEVSVALGKLVKNAEAAVAFIAEVRDRLATGDGTANSPTYNQIESYRAQIQGNVDSFRHMIRYCDQTVEQLKPAPLNAPGA